MPQPKTEPPASQDSFQHWLQNELKGTSAGEPFEAGPGEASQSPPVLTDQVEVPYFDMDRLTAEMGSPMDGDRMRYLQHMKKTGNLRRLRRIPDQFDFSRLRDNFPNFSDVSDFLARQVELCRLSPKRLAAFQPLLLLGDPGIGKTRYIFEVSRMLGLEFAVVQCGGVTASFVLSGSCTSWHGGKPGKVHTTLRDGATANPIILLDEIDKLSGASDYDPHGPLYQLLEKKTARVFVDEAIDLPMDASHIIWVATANALPAIPEAILSRLVVIDVPAPAAEHIPQIATSIYGDILDEHESTWGMAFSRSLDAWVMEKLVGLTPRDIRKHLLAACGNAALRLLDTPKSGPIALSPEDLAGLPGRRSRGMGFCA
jgi:ATP-dependent Lon protease